MDSTVVFVILIIAGAVASYIGGKRAELVKFSKELGEAFLAVSEFLALGEDATREQKIKAAEKLKKEWADVYAAGGGLFKKVIGMVQRK